MKKLAAGTEKLGVTLTPVQLEQFEVYCREMLDWNSRINLTSITGYEEVQVKHFLDSLTIVPVMGQAFSGEDLSVIDVGTGAGMPGLPLKILFPDIRLTLLDATAKKTDFLHYIVSTLKLTNVNIVTARAEETAHRREYRESYDVVLSRAVAPLATLTELTLPFCSIGGKCIFPKKGDITRELDDAEKAIQVLGGVLRQTREIELEELPDERRLVIIEKSFATPHKYPRRPGIPEKRPIK